MESLPESDDSGFRDADDDVPTENNDSERKMRSSYQNLMGERSAEKVNGFDR